MRIKRKTITAIIACSLLWGTTATTEPVRVGVLQYKLNRLYFDEGEEKNIFIGSRFTLYHSTDSLLSGLVETVLPGLSISRPLSDSLSTDIADSIYAIVQVADEDSGAVINLGTDIPLDRLLHWGVILTPAHPADTGSIDTTCQLDTTAEQDVLTIGSQRIIGYQNRVEMLHDFDSRRLDGLLSYRIESRHATDRPAIARLAPFMCVLMPNLSRDVNRAATLTTSIYYRFDDARIALHFDGDRVIPLYSFTDPEKPDRSYPFDPSKGRSLFRRAPGRPGRLNIYVAQPELERAAAYLSDVLSRDRCRVRLVGTRGEADLFLEFVPFDTNDESAAIEYILDTLSLDTVSGSSATQAVQSARTQLHWSRSDPDTSRQAYYWQLIDRRLLYDIGIFPLFRPTIFVVTDDLIKGLRSGPDGRLDLCGLRKIIIPSRSEVIIR
ncbi:MAG: hypothetical protein JSU65_01515 [Candidatus Zixiibacteriota bacterium]|nr:MAG: hypothetical protein JSU65_01515 [candidate division Zixibacteria bacterium]